MLIARLASALIFAVGALYCVGLTAQDGAQGDIRSVATRLENQQPVTAKEIDRAAQAVLSASSNHDCRSDILRPGLSVVLYWLAQTNRATDYDQWAQVNAQGQAYLLSMIRCLPSDGNVWLREALVSRAIAENPAGLKARMEIARALMPFEEQQIIARLYFWNRISPLALLVSGDIAREDVRTGLRYGTASIKAILKSSQLSPAFAALVKQEAASIR